MPQPPMYPEQDPWTEEDTRAVQQETGGDFRGLPRELEKKYEKIKKSENLVKFVEKPEENHQKNVIIITYYYYYYSIIVDL